MYIPLGDFIGSNTISIALLTLILQCMLSKVTRFRTLSSSAVCFVSGSRSAFCLILLCSEALGPLFCIDHAYTIYQLLLLLAVFLLGNDKFLNYHQEYE